MQREKYLKGSKGSRVRQKEKLNCYAMQVQQRPPLFPQGALKLSCLKLRKDCWPPGRDQSLGADSPQGGSTVLQMQTGQLSKTSNSLFSWLPVSSVHAIAIIMILNTCVIMPIFIAKSFISWP